jgi:hypothetical protein
MRDLLRRRGKTVLRLFLVSSVMTGLIACGDDEGTTPVDGTLQIIADTEGIDFDPTGYLWSVNGSQGAFIGHQDSVVVPALEAGDYVVALSGMDENCTVPAEENPQTATVVPGDTVDVLFNVTCELLDDPDDGGENPAVRSFQSR